jgi:hypothetical protein
MGHSNEVFHRNYVKAHRDALERDRARAALVELGLGVAPLERAQVGVNTYRQRDMRT